MSPDTLDRSLTDDDGRVYRILINEKHHAAVERSQRRLGIAVALLVFSLTCLIGASLSPLVAWALVGFAGTVSLYAVLLRAGLYNEIEGAVVCEILLLMFLVSLPILLPR